MNLTLSLNGSSLRAVDADSKGNDYDFPLLSTMITYDEEGGACELSCEGRKLYFTPGQVSSPTLADIPAVRTQMATWLSSATLKVDNVELNNVTFDGSTLAKDASLTSILAQLVTNQNIGGKSESLTPDTLAVTASSAYASGNLVGNKMKFTGILGAKKTGILHSLCIRDISNTAKLPMQLIIFNADPSATTFTDKSAFTINAADKAKIMRSIPIAASDYVTIGGVPVVDLRNLGGVIKSATQDLFACLVATGAGSGNFSATTDLNISIGVIQD